MTIIFVKLRTTWTLMCQNKFCHFIDTLQCVSLRLLFDNSMYKITIRRSFLINFTQYAHIHDRQVKIILNRHFVSRFTSLPILTCFFQPWFWPKFNDVEYWLIILNLVMSNTSQISNFKKIRSKLRPWQCPRFFRKRWRPLCHHLC